MNSLFESHCQMESQERKNDFDMNRILQVTLGTLVGLQTHKDRVAWCETFDERWTAYREIFLKSDDVCKTVKNTQGNSPLVYRVRFAETVIYKTHKRVSFAYYVSAVVLECKAKRGPKKRLKGILRSNYCTASEADTSCKR